MSEPSLGQIAYETFIQQVDLGEDGFWRAWQNVTEFEREAWDEAGDAVRAYLTQDMAAADAGRIRDELTANTMALCSLEAEIEQAAVRVGVDVAGKGALELLGEMTGLHQQLLDGALRKEEQAGEMAEQISGLEAALRDEREESGDTIADELKAARAKLDEIRTVIGPWQYIPSLSGWVLSSIQKALDL